MPRWPTFLLFYIWTAQLLIHTLWLYLLSNALKMSISSSHHEQILFHRCLSMLLLIAFQIVLIFLELVAWIFNRLTLNHYIISQSLKVYIWWMFHSWVSGLADAARDSCREMKHSYLWETLLNETASVEGRMQALRPTVMVDKLPNCYPNNIHSWIMSIFL